LQAGPINDARKVFWSSNVWLLHEAFSYIRRFDVMSPLALSIRFLQTQPDSKLLELARAGHERAFEALVQRYRRPLLNYCRRLSSSEASAEDALQQSLLQAWIALSTGESEIRNPRAWLYRIVHNVAISNLRRPVHDQVREDQARDGGGADQEVERRLALRDALAGLAALPDLQRQVMLSTALEGQSHEEVAAALGLTHGAVRGLIYRARATLRTAAAVLVPGPLVSWAAGKEIGSGRRSSGLAEAITGGGSAGVAGAVLKGGAIVATAGALAGAAGVALPTHSHGSRAHKPLSAQLRPAADTSAHGTSAAGNHPGVPVDLSRTGQPVASAAGSAGGGLVATGAGGRSGWSATPGGDRSLPTRGGGPSQGGSSSSPGGPSPTQSSGSGSGSGSGGHDGGSSTSSGSGSGELSGSGGSGGGDGMGAVTATAVPPVTYYSSSSDGGSGSGTSGSGTSGGGSDLSSGSGPAPTGSTSGSSDGGSTTTTATSSSGGDDGVLH
jgi:RNA polymerase sigma factor (sigma-70 family)